MKHYITNWSRSDLFPQLTSLQPYVSACVEFESEGRKYMFTVCMTRGTQVVDIFIDNKRIGSVYHDNGELESTGTLLQNQLLANFINKFNDPEKGMPLRCDYIAKMRSILTDKIKATRELLEFIDRSVIGLNYDTDINKWKRTYTNC